MKYINRWGIMFNLQKEDLMQHSLECAFIAQYLATVGNMYFGKNYNAERIAVCAMYHDIEEVLTGDLPTPIKYYNEEMKNIYKQIEVKASEKLLDHLPKNLQGNYSAFISGSNLTDAEQKILKIADKLCAYIKCINELNAGNKEFQAALNRVSESINNIESEELAYFIKNVLPEFSLSLHEIKGML